MILQHKVTFKGTAITLEGNAVEVGKKAPDFTALANNLTPKTLADYKGKTLLICTVPSLDTGVCDMQTRKFNEEAEKLDDSVQILTISCDLPFAQARWCGANGVEKLITLSDHKDLSFGRAYGVVVKELRLLTRAVFIINKEGILTYAAINDEIAKEPDYAAALAALKKVL